MATPERLFPNASRSDIRSRFHLGKQLGQGGTGVVTVCSDLQTGIPVAACKSVPKSKLQRRDALEELQREVHANRRVRGHAHVVELRALYEDERAVHLVMDLCKGGDLYDYLIARSPVAEPVAAEICRQVLLALAHCHSMGVMHRDIKPENILLASPNDGSSRPHVKLADFGLAVLLRPGQRAVGMYGSAIYMSPEVVCRRPYGHAVDLWGLGVIAYLALAGYMPFWGSTDEELFLRILRNSPDFRADPWPSVSPQAVDFIRSLLRSDPAHRPSALAALQHPWIVQHCGGPAIPPAVAPAVSAEPMPGMTPKAPSAARKSAPMTENGAKGHVEAGKVQQLPRAGSTEAGGEGVVTAPLSTLNKIRVGGAGRSAGQSAGQQGAHEGRAMDVDTDHPAPAPPAAPMPAAMKQPRQAPKSAIQQSTEQARAAQAKEGDEMQPLQRRRAPQSRVQARGKSTKNAAVAEQVRGRSRTREVRAEGHSETRAMDVDETTAPPPQQQPPSHTSHAPPPILVPVASPKQSPSHMLSQQSQQQSQTPNGSQPATPTAPASRPRASHFRFFSPKRKSRAAHVTVAAPSEDSTPSSIPGTPDSRHFSLDSPSASSAAGGGDDDSNGSTSPTMAAAPSCFPVFRRQPSSSSSTRSRTATPKVITVPLRTPASATSASEVTTVEIPCIETEPPLDPTKQPLSMPELQARLSQPDGSLPVPALLSYLRPRASSPRLTPAASGSGSASAKDTSASASAAPSKRSFAKPAWMEAIRAAKPEDSPAGGHGAAIGGAATASVDARRMSSEFLASHRARKPTGLAGLAVGNSSGGSDGGRASSKTQQETEQVGQVGQPKRVQSPVRRPMQLAESPRLNPLEPRQSPKPSASGTSASASPSAPALVDPRQSPRPTFSSPRTQRGGGKLIPALVLPMRVAGTEAEGGEKSYRRRELVQRRAGVGEGGAQGEGGGAGASVGEESTYLSCKSPSSSSSASSVTEGWSPFVSMSMSSGSSVSGSSNAGSGGSSPYHAGDVMTPALTSVMKARALVRAPGGSNGSGQAMGEAVQQGEHKIHMVTSASVKSVSSATMASPRMRKSVPPGGEGGVRSGEGIARSAEGGVVRAGEGGGEVKSGAGEQRSLSQGPRKARGLGSIVRAFAALSTAHPDAPAAAAAAAPGAKSASVPTTPSRNPFSSHTPSSARSASARASSARLAGATSAGRSASVAAAGAAAAANVSSGGTTTSLSSAPPSDAVSFSGCVPGFKPPVPKWGSDDGTGPTSGRGGGGGGGGGMAGGKLFQRQLQQLQQQGLQQQGLQQQQGGAMHVAGVAGLAPGGTWLASR